MNSHAHPRRRDLHLVTAAAATISKPAALECEALPPERPQPDQVEARQVAERILEYQTLQDEFDAEVLSGAPDLDHVADLIMKLSACRKQIRAYAARVQA